MPVLTMENVENMFDKIKKGRVKNSTCTCKSSDLKCMTVDNQSNEVFMDFEFKSSLGTGTSKKKEKIERENSYSNQDLVSNAQNHKGLEMMIKQHPAVKKMTVKTNSENTLKRKAGRPKKFAIVDFRESQLNDQLASKIFHSFFFLLFQCHPLSCFHFSFYLVDPPCHISNLL
jgi:hypothetical protein